MAEPPGVGVPGMGDPGADAAFHLLNAHGAGPPAVAQPPQPVAETAHIVLGQAAPAVAQQHVAQELRRLGGLGDEGLAGMEAEPAAGQVGGDPLPPVRQHAGVVVEQGEVVDVVLSGALDIPDYEARRSEILACSWLPPRWEWVDPLKDARAEIEQIDAGLKSRTQAIAERGYDAEQVDAEIAADKARERELGLSFGKPAPGTPDPAPDTTASIDQAALG